MNSSGNTGGNSPEDYAYIDWNGFHVKFKTHPCGCCYHVEVTQRGQVMLDQHGGPGHAGGAVIVMAERVPCEHKNLYVDPFVGQRYANCGIVLPTSSV